MSAIKTVCGPPISDMSTFTGEIFYVNGIPHEKLEFIEWHCRDKEAYDDQNTVWKSKPVTLQPPILVEDKDGNPV